jgi:tRNA(fMet)-specific endonuclease VapC
MICLDTNAVIALLGGEASPVRSRFEDAIMRKQTVAASSIVLFELWYGVGKSARRESNASKISEFSSSPVQILSFDAEDSEEAGDIRAALKRAGAPIGPYDILIAAQARRRAALLVTANTREFERVPGLRIEDWTAPMQRENR